MIMGLSVARLTCDDCRCRHRSGYRVRDQSARLLAKSAREDGWEKMGDAWLCEECAEKFRRIEPALFTQAGGGP